MAETPRARVEDYHGRLLFEGNEDDAERFIEEKFPHVHNEPGMNGPNDQPVADVVLVDAGGNTHAFVGGKWSEVNYEVRNGRFAHPRPKKAAAKTAGTDEKK